MQGTFGIFTTAPVRIPHGEPSLWTLGMDVPITGAEIVELVHGGRIPGVDEV